MTSLLSFLQGLGQLLLHSFWLMGFCWLMALIILRTLKNSTALLKQKVLTLLLALAFIALGLLAYCIFVSNNPKSLVIYTWQIQHQWFIGNEVSNWIQYISVIFSALYVLGMVRQLVVFSTQLRALRSYSYFSSSKVPIHLKLYLEEQRHLLGIKRKIEIVIKEHLSSACTIGFWKPVILIPAAALTQLTTTQLEAILLHELSHIKKFDFILNWILVVFEQLFFFNPFVIKMSSLIKEYREQSSDELVLQFKYNPLTYAEALLKLAKHEHQVNPLFIAATDGMLKRRIEKMLYARSPKIQFPFFQLFCIALIALVLTVSIKSLPSSKPIVANNNEKTTIGIPELNVIPVSYSINKPSTTGLAKTKKPATTATPSNDLILEEVSFEETPLLLSYIASTEPERAYSLASIEKVNETQPSAEADTKEPYLPKNSFDFKLSSDNIQLSTEADAYKEKLINEVMSEINQLKSIELIEKESGSDLTAEKERTTLSIKSKIENFNKLYPNQLNKALSVDQLSKQLLSLKYKSKALELKSKKENLFAEYKYIIQLSSDSTGKKIVVF